MTGRGRSYSCYLGPVIGHKPETSQDNGVEKRPLSLARRSLWLSLRQTSSKSNPSFARDEKNPNYRKYIRRRAEDRNLWKVGPRISDDFSATDQAEQRLSTEY